MLTKDKLTLKKTKLTKDKRSLNLGDVQDSYASQDRTSQSDSGKNKYCRTTGERIAKLGKPTLSEKELLDKIIVLSREPFSEVLAMFLDNKPSRKAVKD